MSESGDASNLAGVVSALKEAVARWGGKDEGSEEELQAVLIQGTNLQQQLRKGSNNLDDVSREAVSTLLEVQQCDGLRTLRAISFHCLKSFVDTPAFADSLPDIVASIADHLSSRPNETRAAVLLALVVIERHPELLLPHALFLLGSISDSMPEIAATGNSSLGSSSLMLLSGILDIAVSSDSDIAKEVLAAAQKLALPMQELAGSTMDMATQENAKSILSRLQHLKDGAANSYSEAKAATAERTYSEAEVKSFLQQRKIEFEAQIRKREKMAAEQQQEVQSLNDRLNEQNKNVTEYLARIQALEERAESLDKQVSEMHQKHIVNEGLLEEKEIFLREQEHHLEQVTKRASQLEKENTLLGEEAQQLREANRELTMYVTELMDGAEKRMAQQQQQQQ